MLCIHWHLSSSVTLCQQAVIDASLQHCVACKLIKPVIVDDITKTLRCCKVR